MSQRRLTIVTSLTYSPDEEHVCEATNTEPSLTVPDMAMSVEEIMQRFTRGQTVTEFEPMYYDEEIPDIDAMDLAELHEYRQELALHIEELQQIQQEIDSRTPKSTEVQQSEEKSGDVVDQEQP